MFPFQIDLSRLSYIAVWETIVAPMLTGGTIALGWLYAREGVWGSLHDEMVLKIVVAVFAVYVVGTVVLYLSAFELAAVALAVLIRQTESIEPWKNREWRRLASKFLGEELSPPVEEPQAAPPTRQSQPAMGAERLSRIIDENFAKGMAPLNFQLRWQKWHGVLKAYWAAPTDPGQSFGHSYFASLNSIGWAGFVAAYMCGNANWLVWLACALTIVVSHIFFTLNLSQQRNPDPSGEKLAAEILRAIKSHNSA